MAMASPIVGNDQCHDNNAGSQPSSDCLSTPVHWSVITTAVVLRIILEHLPNSDLLRVSLVNKLWNYEARSVLKNRGNLFATLKSISPCQTVGAFASDLRQMSLVPFSGIHIELAAWLKCDGCESSSAGALDPNYGIILDRIPWKRLRFEWGKNWEEGQKCQAILLALKILQDRSEDLEELKIRLGGRSETFMQKILQHCKFPQLKTLDLRAIMKAPDEDCTALTKALISRAPKLQEFRESWWVNLDGNVVEGTAAALVTHMPVRPAYGELPERALASLRLTEVILEVTGQDFSVERFNRITPLLLQNSKSTLKDLRMDAVFALPLMCYGIRLEGVTGLRLRLDHHHLELNHPRVLTFLKAFDFTRIFPNVSHVVIETVSNHMASEQMNEFILQVSAAALLSNVPAPDRAGNIVELSMPESVEDSAIPFLAAMFPDIKTLSINWRQGREFPYGMVWESFKGFEKLGMYKRGDVYGNMGSQNFDSVFCGIFPEEVTQLMEEDEEYLKNVNIVPVMPAVTCLSGLKNIEIDMWNLQNHHIGVHDGPVATAAPQSSECGPAFLFSKVTGLIAFRRIPRLSVSIAMHTNSPGMEQALNHLRPYATVSLHVSLDH